MSSTDAVAGQISVAMQRLRVLFDPEHDAFGYGFAVATTAAAVLVVLGIEAATHLRVNLVLIAPIAICARYSGMRGGLAAALIASLAIVLIIGHRGRPAMDTPGVGTALYVGTFALIALVIGATSESLRAEQRRALAQAATLSGLNARLEQHTEEVTALSEHLQDSNDSLAAALAKSRDTANRAMTVQQVTALLAKAGTAGEVADIVLEEGLAALGAARGFLARVEDDGHRVALIRAHGYAPEVLPQLTAATQGMPMIVEAVRTREVIWLRTPDEHPTRLAHFIEPRPYASAWIPLISGTDVIGGLAFIFVDPGAIGPATEAFTLVLAHAAGDALARARSYDAERDARERAEMLASARADVLSVVAHDLRNPLSRMKATADFLLDVDDMPVAERRRMLDVARRAAMQMNRLIEDLLDATRLQAGRLSLELSDVDVAALLRDAEETLRPAASERGVRLETQLETQVAADTLRMRADADRVLQVLGNLVGNAIKFSPPGERVITVVIPSQAHVTFTVADKGPGIPAEHLDHLFEQFWQARDGDRRGVGLGLTISKGIVEAHGGRIWAESTPGQGTTFSFTIPIGS